LKELDRAAKQQNESMELVEADLRAAETDLADLKRERALKLAGKQKASTASDAAKRRSALGWGVLLKCVALAIFILLVAEILFRYYDICWDSLYDYLLEHADYRHINGRPT
jgi:hypothetical protein